MLVTWLVTFGMTCFLQSSRANLPNSRIAANTLKIRNLNILSTEAGALFLLAEKGGSPSYLQNCNNFQDNRFIILEINKKVILILVIIVSSGIVPRGILIHVQVEQFN